MPTNQQLGVYGYSLPTKKSKVVNPADFLIGGIELQAERKYKKVFPVTNMKEYQVIFGNNINSSWYGYQSAEGFFNNSVGTNAKLYVRTLVGNTGAAYDAVSASAAITDTEAAPAALMTINAAYQGELEYGISGNRTGYTITNGYRFSTTAAGTCAANGTSVVLNSVAGIKVGDILEFSLTGGGAETDYKQILTVDQSTNTITWTGGISSGAKTIAIGDAVQVMGFRLRTWRKDTNGIITEVDTDLGKIWCSTEAQVSDFYVVNVFASSNWIKVTRGAATVPNSPDANKIFPANAGTIITAIVFLASGADGTAATTTAHWSFGRSLFDTLPVRMICNPETTDITTQKAIETYGRSRTDLPKVIYNQPGNRTKAQAITIGNNLQRADDVLGVYYADWVLIQDPFSTSVLAPARSIPNVGHVMGAIIRTIGTKGIHYVPTKDIALNGIIGIDNSAFGLLSDTDRTDLYNAGVNIIQNLTGFGYIMRNCVTPSTTLEFSFFNAIMMREYIKISAVDSLQTSENTPNSYENIKNDRMAILKFMYDLWFRGSTNSVPTGETFGQTFNTDGTPTKPEDHFEVIADLTNNSQATINAGQRFIDTYFTYPAPTISLRVGVGIMLRS